LFTNSRFGAVATLLRLSRKLTSPRGPSGVTIISATTTPTSAGSPSASHRTVRSSGLPGAAKARRRFLILSACAVMHAFRAATNLSRG